MKYMSSMCEDVAKAGGKITAIYSCPHHWEENCLCRKPAPGMLKRAAIDFGIDLSKTYFAGDSDSDCDAANLVDCNFLRVTENQSLYEISKGIRLDDCYEDTASNFVWGRRH